MLRVLVVDESPERAEVLREGLARAGCEVAASLGSPLALLQAIAAVKPDVVVIDTESPSRDVLEHLVAVSREEPRPIVMFARDADAATIRAVMRAGVSAYVVDEVDPARVRSIIDVACARFEEFQRLRAALAEANLKLAERKVVERAKGILMQARRLNEDEAYRALRRLAMDRNLRLADLAQALVDASELLA